MKSLLLALLALALATTAPAQTAPHKTKIKVKAPPRAVKPQPAPILTFQRGACLGSCPAYVLSVFADGRVAYEGQQNVAVLGKKEFRLARGVVNEMLRRTQEAHFFDLKELYSNGATDIPATIVAVRQPNGKLKTVTVEGDAPEALQNLLGYLRGQFDALAGVKESR